MPKVSRTRRQRERDRARNLYTAGAVPQKIGHTTAYRRWLIRRTAGFSLIGIGAVMAFVHVVVHLGSLQFLPTTGLQPPRRTAIGTATSRLSRSTRSVPAAAR